MIKTISIGIWKMDTIQRTIEEATQHRECMKHHSNMAWSAAGLYNVRALLSRCQIRF